ncbi:MAG: pseudouridine synthase [Nitrospirota bacterium]|nr:pseudouridine synthase [Nitrospirota bacterium]
MEKAGQARQEGVGLAQERSKREDRRPKFEKAASRTLAFNKPYGVLPCFTDAQGRPTLADYVNIPEVYAAGRLDLDSEGLMLLTSEGALAHYITDPEHKLPKVYLAQVERIPTDEALEQLRRGVLLNGKRTRPAEVQLLSEAPNLPDRPVPIRFRKSVPTAWLQITLREGLNRQVRRMTAAVGHPTLRLIRMAIEAIVLGDLQPGQWRELAKSEVAQISRSAESRDKKQRFPISRR